MARGARLHSAVLRTSLLLPGVLGVLLALTPWWVVNVEPSVPYGLYGKTRLPAALARGILVVFSPPASMHAWKSWTPFLKPIAALPGDQVCILSTGLWINGTPYGKVHVVAQGKPLPRLRGCQVVPPGHVFVATQTARTLDSRYFGNVPISALTAQAHPLVTWR